MTKLQSIIAEIKSLPLEDQQVVISELVYLIPSVQEEYVFSDEEWVEIEEVLKNDKGSFTVDEVFASIKEKYVSDTAKH